MYTAHVQTQYTHATHTNSHLDGTYMYWYTSNNTHNAQYNGHSQLSSLNHNAHVVFKVFACISHMYTYNMPMAHLVS